MTPDDASETFYSLGDGLGTRTLLADSGHGQLEMLEVSADLATSPSAEQAIRSRAARVAELRGQPCAVVRRVERVTSALRVVAHAPAGVRLSTLLLHLELRAEALPEVAVIELAASLAAPLAAIHRLPGGVAHGALCPAHVLVAIDGSVVLTDCVFGAALSTLARTREQFWRDFGLALPPGPDLPRFDQRADVTQLAMVVLSMGLRRPLQPDEYPRAVSPLILRATDGSTEGGPTPAFRVWLQRAFQLDGHAAFNSAVDAERALTEIAAGANERRAAARAIQALVRKVRAQPLAETPALTV